MAADPRSTGARGGIVTVFGQVAKVAIQLGAVVVLSRLLAPTDFGLLAMATVFVMLGNLLRDFGMPTAALQARTLTQGQASNLFWINVALGSAGTAGLIAFTPLIVALYSEPQLAILVPALSSTLLLGSVAAQFQVRLARSFRFVALAVADVTAQAIGLIVAIALAICGYGVWALAWQAIFAAAIQLVLVIVLARWTPSLPSRDGQTARLAKSGMDYGAAYLMSFAASNADTVSIGAQWGAAPLGYYSRAFQLLALPIQVILNPLTNVVVPLANRWRQDGRDVDELMVRVQFAVSAAAVAVFVCSAATAPALLPLALGDDWNPSVILFQILAVGGAFQTLSFVGFWRFIIFGLSRHLLYYNLVTKGLSIVLIIVASFSSVEMVAVAYALGLAIAWPANLVWLWRAGAGSPRCYLLAGLEVIVSAAIGFSLSIFTVDYFAADMPALLQVLIGAVVALCSSLAFLLLVPDSRRRLFDSVALLRSALVARSSSAPTEVPDP